MEIAPSLYLNCSSSVFTLEITMQCDSTIQSSIVHQMLCNWLQQATRSYRHIIKITFGDRNTIYLCLEVVASIKFNYFPCGFKSRAASVKFNYFPLRFTWQRCHCYLRSASGQSESLSMICSIIPSLPS